jgi:hypothetical protein
MMNRERLSATGDKGDLFLGDCDNCMSLEAKKVCKIRVKINCKSVKFVFFSVYLAKAGFPDFAFLILIFDYCSQSHS